MPFTPLTLFKWLDAPGSIPVLVLCCLIGAFLAFVWPRKRRLARRWLASVLGVYLLLALPCVAAGIAGKLPAVSSPRPSAGAPIYALVVFDGDNRRGRVREAKRLYDLDRPATVWSLGYEDWLKIELPKAGIPADRVSHDLKPSTTRAQVEWVRQLAETHKAGDIVVVASRLQMPRVAALFRAIGVQPMLAASAVDTEPSTSGVRLFLPSYFALRVSRDALYEHFALVYYRHKGWI